MTPGFADVFLRRIWKKYLPACMAALLTAWPAFSPAETKTTEMALLEPRYIPLQKHGIYDVEVLVFSRGTRQAARKAGDAGWIDMDSVLQLTPKPEDWPEWKTPDNATGELQKNTSDQSINWTMPVDPQDSPPLVLTDFVRDDLFLLKTADKLTAQPNWRVLFHKKWRLQPSDFNQPTFIDLSTIPKPLPETAPGYNSNILAPVNENHPVIGLLGKMAFSKGRYLHIEVQLQAVFPSFDNLPLVATLKEKRRVRSEVLHYFDHPDLGLLVRITPVTRAMADEAISAPPATHTNEQT